MRYGLAILCLCGFVFLPNQESGRLILRRLIYLCIALMIIALIIAHPLFDMAVSTIAKADHTPANSNHYWFDYSQYNNGTRQFLQKASFTDQMSFDVQMFYDEMMLSNQKQKSTELKSSNDQKSSTDQNSSHDQKYSTDQNSSTGQMYSTSNKYIHYQKSSIHPNYSNKQKILTDLKISTDQKSSTDQILLACQMPEVDPYEPSVMNISGLNLTTLRCEGTYLPDLTYVSEGGTLNVNASKIEEYRMHGEFDQCRYLIILRNITDDNSFSYSQWSNSFTDTIALTKDAEFLNIVCSNTKGEIVSNKYFCLIPRKEQFNEWDSTNFKKRQVMTSPKETLNIIMVGMDTLTRHQFIRGCNKTYSHLMNSLESFDLTMHSQLGENTFPNFLSLFAGQSQDEVKEWWSDDNHMDSLDLIWHTFDKAGYVTLYTEDMPTIGAFHYLKKGFARPFARYNSRPLALAMYEDFDIWKYYYNCAGNQVELNVHLDYVLRFLDTFPDKPVFAVAMLTKPTHDIPMYAKIFDEHLFNFYQSLNQKGHLNKSLIVSFSDHGVRWGALRESVNGVFESRSPYTILTFPDWFLKKYPDVTANLRANTKRLTTHFDTHATLLDLLYFKSNSKPLAPLRHGVSLFEEIHANRTCKEAFIPKEFCLCGYRSLGDINVTSNLSKTLTGIVLEALNSKTDKNVCAVLELHQTVRILKIALNEDSTTGERDTTVYKVTLETVPGRAVYEANVYAVGNSSQWKVGNSISRLNRYDKQADCVDIADNRPYCYCKSLLTN